MNTTLLPFQKQTVDWMKLRKGGFIYHEQGLGKTICVINYLISTNQWKDTLIVCPSSLIDMWKDQIIQHCNITSSDIGIFHSSNRNSLFDKESQGKLFISSYSIIAVEYKNILKNLHLDQDIQNTRNKQHFFFKQFTCIVLDEAHYIRNRTSQSSLAICNFLKQTQKPDIKWWILTATPIVNIVDDVYSHFRLLDIHGIETIQDFRNITPKSNHGLANVNAIIKQFGIRYLKLNVLEQLQCKNETVIELPFSDLEKDFYNSLYEYSRIRLLKLSQRTNLSNNELDTFIKKMSSMIMLTLILRLKQSCNSIEIVINSMNKLSNQSILQAIETLNFYNQQKSLETECIICLDKYGDQIINPCGHKLCGTCTFALDKYHITQCPMCRSHFTSIDIIHSPKSLHTHTSPIIPQSTKVNKLFEIINDNVVSKGQKIVIVSQWVTMLNKVSESIKNRFNQPTLVLSGEYSIKERYSIVKKFQTDNKYKIILVSLNSSAEGITLTSAQTMVHLDLWWNKAKEEQVTDRIHRIGQKNKVDIIHLRIKDTIEQPIAKLVQKKKKISENVLSNETVEKIRLKDDSWINDIIKIITRTTVG